MRQSIPKILSHVAAWLAFLAIPLLLLPQNKVRLPPPAEMVDKTPEPMRALFFLSLNVLLIGFFYLNYYLLIPRLWTRQRRWQYFASIAASFLALQLLVLGSNALLLSYFNAGMEGRFFPGMGVFSSFLMFSLAWASSSGIRLSAEWKKAEARRRESENAHLNAELNQLKSQLNPHFLFNTLHGIYTLALAKDDAAPSAVLKLSHLLRYVTAETGEDFVPLEHDLEHLQHFVSLHQMRLTDQTPVNFTVDGNPYGYKIAPLMLLPFVENAFKFGSSTRDLSPIDIGLKIKDKTLEFTCKNLIKNTGQDSTGIGITNTRRRLELLYPDRYSLEITENEGIFSVYLFIEV
ncbi:MAG: histidine kinase [Lewinellaceae bacterium]|nr:histidine kinase [Lewinellaceae bacterium]